ncbi:MAG: COR domain-containing protein, partial [Bacteroidota bacterium]
KLALSFMLSAEICYRLNDPDREKGEEKIYVAPQLLPPDAPISIHRPKESGLLFQYKYAYLHQVFIHRLIVRAGKLALADHVWQNGIQFYWGGTFVIVEAVQDIKGPGGYIQIQVSGDKEFELLKRLGNEFDRIHPQGMNYQNLVSLDGETWVDLKKIEDARKDPENVSSILCEDGKGVDPKEYGVFFGERRIEEGIKELEPQIPGKITLELITQWKNQILNNDVSKAIEDMKPYALNDEKLFTLIFSLGRFKDEDTVGIHGETERSTIYRQEVFRLVTYLGKLEESFI